MQSLYDDLEARGILKQVTDPNLRSVLSEGPLTLYAGFDPTSDCLHLGNLLPLLTLRRFQLAGHRPIAVVGGATGMIGDPSGKSQERKLLDDKQLKINLAGITKVISRFLDFTGKNAAVVVNNADWYEGVSYIEFLRDVGKHFTINHMMAKESVRARLEDREHGISYTEFSYMLLQAYDFQVLNQKEKCRLQIGGSDQWGNITAGIELIRRMNAHSDKADEGPSVFGLTHPLVTRADGGKFGKTESGALWLDGERTSAYQLYQYLIQTPDSDVVSLLHFFTFLSVEEIKALEASVKTEPEKRLAQNALARELTKLVHGEASLDRAIGASQALFGTGIRELDEKTLLDVLAGAPSTEKAISLLEPGYAVIDALVDSGLSASKGAARKEIAGGGVYVNNLRVADPAAVLRKTDLIAGAHLVLRRGKKTYHLVSFK